VSQQSEHFAGADQQHGSASAPASAPGPAASTELALLLIRHGETEWSRTGRHTGRTDVPLTRDGEHQAIAAGQIIRRLLGDLVPQLVLSSPRQRAARTAELAGYVPELTEDAAEWDYGQLEGLTGPEIADRYPDWTVWSGPVPGGEDADQVSSRIDRLLARAAAAERPVLVFSHGHASRCIAARWLAEPVTAGRHYRLDTGAVAALGYEHGRAVILQWNIDKRVAGVPG
jgi:probable phosphoglycerate mutase